MKQFSKFISRGCLYAIMILTVFYFFALIAKFPETSINISKYFTVLGFGMLISASTMLFELKIHTLIKHAINYSVLLAAFCVIFLSATSNGVNVVAKVFISLIVFSVIYFACLLISKAIRTALTPKNATTKKHSSIFSDKRGK